MNRNKISRVFEKLQSIETRGKIIGWLNLIETSHAVTLCEMRIEKEVKGK